LTFFTVVVGSFGWISKRRDDQKDHKKKVEEQAFVGSMIQHSKFVRQKSIVQPKTEAKSPIKRSLKSTLIKGVNTVIKDN